MSYHETYEFLAIDRCLTRSEMRALRAISTRATITPSRFYNFYDWGGLRGDPRDMLRRYFDLFVYTGNGRPELGMLRFPADRLDLTRWRPYVTKQRGATEPASGASVATEGDTVILTMRPAEDTTLWPVDRETIDDVDNRWPDDYFEDELLDEAAWPVPLALVRADLLAGDLRPLYLLWLLSVQCGERRATTVAPPRPPNLAPLTGSLHVFAEFLRLNPDLLTIALETRQSGARTVEELLTAADAWSRTQRRKEAERAAAARSRRLAALEKRQETEWREIERELDAPRVRPSIYDDAMRRLTALHELAVDRRNEAAFRGRLRALLDRQGKKTSLQRRVKEAGLEAGTEAPE